MGLARTLERWLLAAAAVCVGAVVARCLGVASPVLPQVWDKAYNGAEFCAIAVIFLRALRARGGERAAWAVLALGLLGYAAADIYYLVALRDLAEAPYPSPADAGYLSIFPATFAALALLLRARAPRLSSKLWLDGLICALAAAAVGSAVVLPLTASTEGSFAAVATNVAYPLGDCLILAFVGSVMVLAGRAAGWTWRVLALAFTVWAVADTIYLYQVAVGSYREYTLLDIAWPAAHVLFALAACLPADRLDARQLRRGMLVLPVGGTLLALCLLVFDHYARLHIAAVWLGTAAVAMAVVRFALTFRENLRSLDLSEAEAATDLLTGLGNRRALMRDLEDAERPALLALFDLDGFKGYNDAFGHPAGDALLARLGANLATALAGRATGYRLGGDEFCLLTTDVTLVEHARAALRTEGEGFTIGCSYGVAELAADPAEALRLADQRMYANKRQGRRSSDEAVHQVLLRVAAEHDGELRDHVDDVAVLAEAVARELSLDAQRRLEVRRAAQLHDIGKVAIPDSILHAPRELDANEWEYMRQHTLIGERIIAAAPELAGVARIVRSSHERFDGAGYPDGLLGEDIPLGARIVAVCDTYDAIISDRAYRRGRTREEALAELSRCSGSQFDPEIVAAFMLATTREGVVGSATCEAPRSAAPTASAPKPRTSAGAATPVS
jgi:two-component system cell cycle response regulator